MTTRGERIQVASSARRERARADTRRLILDTAEQLLVQRGYGELSLREVAETIGYSPAAIYRYFEDKDHLVSILHKEGFERFTIALQQAYDSEDRPVERLATLFRAYLRFADENPVHYRLMFIERIEFLQQSKDEVEEETPPSLEVLRSAVREALDRNLIAGDSVEGVADALWASVHGAAALVTCQGAHDEAWSKSLADQVLKLVCSGLEPRP